MSDDDFDIDQGDITWDGAVNFYRQRTDLPFSQDKIVVTSAKFASISRIEAAFRSALYNVQELSDMYPIAWNPEFGYITADPYICGTGLEIEALFHLEGLHLIGDLEPALNALKALRMFRAGLNFGSMRNAAHILRIGNASHIGIDEQSIVSRVSRVFSDLVKQEMNARIRLVEELPRVFEDAIMRSIAILRSCRLISEWELLDIISPLQLAANLDFLENFPKGKARSLMLSLSKTTLLPEPETYEDQKEQDRKDAKLADKVNKLFKSVRLTALAKEMLS